jgi:hypothetical protein
MQRTAEALRQDLPLLHLRRVLMPLRCPQRLLEAVYLLCLLQLGQPLSRLPQLLLARLTGILSLAHQMTE